MALHFLPKNMRINWECHEAHNANDYVFTEKDIVIHLSDVELLLHGHMLQVDLCYDDDNTLVNKEGFELPPPLTGKLKVFLVSDDNSFKIKVNCTSHDKRKFCFWIHCIVGKDRYNWFLSPFYAVTNRMTNHTKRKHEETESSHFRENDAIQKVIQILQTQQLQQQAINNQLDNLTRNVNNLMLLYKYMTTPYQLLSGQLGGSSRV